MLPKDQVFYFNLDIDGEIGGNLSMIGTATLNSLGLKEKANLMPRGEQLAEIVSPSPLPFPAPPNPHTSFAYFTDIWWFYSLKQFVKLSKWTQFCLLFCKFLIFAV